MCPFELRRDRSFTRERCHRTLCLSLVVLRMTLHPPLLLPGRREWISDRPEEHPGGCGAHVLELVLEILQQLPFALPEAVDVSLTEPCSFAKSKIVLAFSTVARIFLSFRTIPGFCINARMSRSDSRATLSGEKSRNAFRKWGHFFSTKRQFKPALKIARDIRSRYPWSSFGGTAFHPAIGTATLC